MRITDLALRDFRNYERVEVALADGLTVVRGSVGTGKTNLLEGLFFACTGRSCRTSNEREMVRFGQKLTRCAIVVDDRDSKRRFDVALELSPKRIKSVRADGEPVHSMADVEGRPLVCAFLPDRMELVKGPAGGRRAHLDTFISALWPARTQTRQAYARALAQRNVLLGRVRAGVATRDSLASWTRELASAGVGLVADRGAAIDSLAPRFAERAAQLGLPDPIGLGYRPRSDASDPDQLEAEITAAIDSDLARGFTTHGPHRDDMRLDAAGRDLRRYGSQGQQRLGLLALLLAERDCLSADRGRPPLLLLDDVLSELDRERRVRLIDAVSGDGQTLISTADADAADSLGSDVSQLEVRDGVLAW